MKKFWMSILFIFSFLFGISTISYAFYYEVQIGYGQNTSDHILKTYQIKKISDFTNVHILTAYASISEIQKMKQDKQISFINYNQNVHVNIPNVQSISTKPLQYNANVYSLIQLPSIQKENITGKNNSICVIDTGVDFKHEALKGKVVEYTSFISERNGVKNTVDYMGHGTHVAGIIAGVAPQIGMYGIAPNAKIYSAKVFNANEDSSVSSMIAGVDWCMSKKVNIMNMSFGFPSTTSYTALSGFDYALQQANKNGILSIASTGNDGDTDKSADNVKYPARFRNVLAVASSNQSGSISLFSNRGPSVFITAPGENVVSSYPNNQYYYMSGTSMASPIVSGIAALIREKNPGISNSNLIYMLKKNSIDKGKRGKDSIYGCGIAQAYPIDITLLKKPPTPATYLSHTLSTDTISLQWNASSDCTTKGYNIYVNNKKINPTLITGTTYKWNYASFGKNINVVIETVDERGLTSKSISKNIPLSYQDVPKNHYAYSAIQYASEKGWLIGTSSLKYEPNRPLTRAEFAHIMSQLANKPSTLSSLPFKDVPKDYWGYKAIATSYQLKMMSGITSTTFAPKQQVTREQMSVTLYRTLRLPLYKGKVNPFIDIKSSNPAYGPILTLYHNKVLSGCTSNRFCPTKNITRAEMAVILQRTGVKLQESIKKP